MIFAMWKFMFLFLISKCMCLYTQHEHILRITSDNYVDHVEYEPKPIFLHAFTPECQQCRDRVNQFVETAEELKGIVKFTYMQIAEERELANELGIRKTNTFYIIRDGHLQQFTASINSRNILAKLDVEHEDIYQKINKNVARLNDENFEMNVLQAEKPWMILFYSPKIHESRYMMAIWVETAQNMRDTVNFASVDCAKNPATAKEYDLAGYPTGVLIIHEATYYLHYNVHLNPSFIMEWIRAKLSEYEEESMLGELTTQYRFLKCNEKPFCILAFLPHIIDCQTKCRNNLLNILMEIHGKYHEQNWGWLWSEIDSQGDLERSLDIDSYAIPTIVVIDTSTKKFTKITGSYSLNDIDDFLHRILMKKIQIVESLKKHVKIYEKNMWNGMDAKMAKNNLDYFDINVKGEL